MNGRLPAAAEACALSIGGAAAGFIIGATVVSHWDAWLIRVEAWHRSRLAKECAARSAVTTRRSPGAR